MRRWPMDGQAGGAAGEVGCCMLMAMLHFVKAHV